ncbi:MAG: hypothetical protein JW882_02520 [Deltaproteobacteria bacterium]|nr:hypothetical protein [Deltaproteobacteria bacterium]
MKLRAIFANSGIPLWIDVASYLKEKYDWEIIYFIGSSSMKNYALGKFPDAVFHTNAEAKINSIPTACKAIKASPLDQNLILRLAQDVSVIIKMLDRNDLYGDFTLQKRLIYCHSQIMYWIGVIEFFKPDVVVFRTAPHMPFDYALYAACKIKGIKTIMFENTAFLGRILPVTSFSEGSPALKENFRNMLKKYGEDNQKSIVLSDEIKKHIETLGKSYNQSMPFPLKYKLSHYKNGHIGGNLDISFNIIKDIIKGVFVKYKDKDYLRKKFYRNIGLFKTNRLTSHYNRIAKEPDFNSPYIFVALQCEPERQTVPCGGAFINQYLMVDLLSKTIPETWKIYVKEHISQFKSYQKAYLGRSFEFYDYIVSLPNVEFVPLSYTSFDLIDASIASATVSGSVGWESVVRGRPSFLFGHAWYKDCEGVFCTSEKSRLIDAIDAIKDGYSPDRNKVLLFAKALEATSFKGAINPLIEKAGTVSHKENVSNFAESINSFMESFPAI